MPVQGKKALDFFCAVCLDIALRHEPEIVEFKQPGQFAEIFRWKPFFRGDRKHQMTILGIGFKFGADDQHIIMDRVVELIFPVAPHADGGQGVFADIIFLVQEKRL